VDLGLRGARALVTAASRGIGRACATTLAREGARVVIASRDAAALDRTAHQIGAAGSVAADLVRAGEPERAVAEAVRVLDGLDIMVVNFPQPAIGRLDEISEEDWARGHDAILLCAVRLIAASRAHLVASGRGRIVTITGMGVREPTAPFVLSGAYRSAVTNLMKSLSAELAPHGVTVNNVAPGSIITDQLRTRLEAAGPDRMEALARSIPAGRVGEPEEVGAVCAFLCSSQAAYVTGQTVGVDGGAVRGVH
jgi:3-oxoacyl-[acyl-carrier protein] reductase